MAYRSPANGVYQAGEAAVSLPKRGRVKPPLCHFTDIELATFPSPPPQLLHVLLFSFAGLQSTKTYYYGSLISPSHKVFDCLTDFGLGSGRKTQCLCHT